MQTRTHGQIQLLGAITTLWQTSKSKTVLEDLCLGWMRLRGRKKNLPHFSTYVVLNSENRNLAASARTTSKLTSKYCGPVSKSTSIKATVVLLRVYQGHLQKHTGWSVQKATVPNTWQRDQKNNYSQLLTFESTWHLQNTRFSQIHPGHYWSQRLNTPAAMSLQQSTREVHVKGKESDRKWKTLPQATCPLAATLHQCTQRSRRGFMYRQMAHVGFRWGEPKTATLQRATVKVQKMPTWAGSLSRHIWLTPLNFRFAGNGSGSLNVLYLLMVLMISCKLHYNSKYKQTKQKTLRPAVDALWVEIFTGLHRDERPTTVYSHATFSARPNGSAISRGWGMINGVLRHRTQLHTWSSPA